MTEESLKLSAVAVVSIDQVESLWADAPGAMSVAARSFEQICDELVDAHGGRRLQAPGVDYVAQFDTCTTALKWGLQLQRALLEVDWPEELLGHPAAVPVIREDTEIFRGLRIQMGLDLGVLQTHVEGLSGQTHVRGETLDAARSAVEDAEPGTVVTSPTCADIIVDGDLGEQFHACDTTSSWWAVVPTELRGRDGFEEPRTARDNLPSFAGAFVHRVDEWEALRSAVESGRLAHLWGAAGAGKTRLAVEFARAWLAKHHAEVWFCDLAEVDHIADALIEIARTSGVQIPRSESIEELEERLMSAWSARGEVMVVLDDVGGLLPELGRSAVEWVERVESLDVVMTSHAEFDEGFEPIRVDALGRASAVALLRDRLQNPAQPEPIDADLSELNKAVEDCGRLPLALELFAGSARRSAEGVFEDATPASLDVEARLERALSRSWETLEQHERDALCACTAFAGNFSHDAAISVVEGTRVDGAAAELLETLRYQSLLRSDGTSHGVRRFIILAPVRDFIGERVGDELGAQASDAHMRCFAEWGERLQEGLAGPDEPLWIGRARVELANLYRAADRAFVESPVDALQIMEGLASLDKRIGSLGGFLERTQSLVESVRDFGDDAPLYRALKVRADTYLWAGQYEPAESDFREMIELAEALDDQVWLAYAESGLGFTRGTLGHEEEALPLVRGAIDAYADDDSYDAITVLTNAAIMARHRNQIDETVDYLHRALTRARQRESIFGQASVLMLMGSTLLFDEQFEESIRYLEEADELFELIGDRRGQVVVYHELGRCYDAIGDVESSDHYYQEAMDLASAVGDREYVAISWLGRGRARFRRGEFAAAESDLLEASITLENISHVHLKLGALLMLAATYGALERLAEAKTYFERVEAIFEETDVTREKPKYEVLYGFLEYARARKAMRTGDEQAARELTAAAWKRVEEHTYGDGGHTPAAERSVERLEAFLERKTDEGQLPVIERAGTPVLRVERELSWFQLDGDEQVDIRRRGAARRILGALAERRIVAPGEALSTQELVDIGWPDEVLVPESGARRIYMTISRMRDMGLEDVIETIDEGYRIDTDVRVVWVRD